MEICAKMCKKSWYVMLDIRLNNILASGPKYPLNFKSQSYM